MPVIFVTLSINVAEHVDLIALLVHIYSKFNFLICTVMCISNIISCVLFYVLITLLVFTVL